MQSKTIDLPLQGSRSLQVEGHGQFTCGMREFYILNRFNPQVIVWTRPNPVPHLCKNAYTSFQSDFPVTYINTDYVNTGIPVTL